MPTPRRMFLSLEAFRKERHLKARPGSMVIDLALHNDDCKANRFRAQSSGRQNIWEPYAGLCSWFSSRDARRKASFYWRGKINTEATSVPKRSEQKRYTCSSIWWLPGQPTCSVSGCPWWKVMTPAKTQWLTHDHRQTLRVCVLQCASFGEKLTPRKAGVPPVMSTRICLTLHSES